MFAIFVPSINFQPPDRDGSKWGLGFDTKHFYAEKITALP